MKKLKSKKLKGPRSYFTDIDPHDPAFDEHIVLNKLKLQLLTKKYVVIAASALFHDHIARIVKNIGGISEAVHGGIIVPALRDEYSDVEAFFGRYKKEGYSSDNLSLFKECVTHVVPWNLTENSNWFKGTFFSELEDPNSFLRKYSEITDDQIKKFRSALLLMFDETSTYFQREHIWKASEDLPIKQQNVLSNFGNLLYRLSGSMVVNSDPHLPDANICSLTDGELLAINDERIFWDIFTESVIAATSPIYRIREEHINKLSFEKILQLRQDLFDNEFVDKYEDLISDITTIRMLKDPGDILKIQENIDKSIKTLRERFDVRINLEQSLKDRRPLEGGLFEVAKIIVRLGIDSTLYPVFATIKGIPKITAIWSPKLADQMDRRVHLSKRWINSKFEWSKVDRKILLEGYEKIMMAGYPTR